MMAKASGQVSQTHIRSLTAKVENHCLNKCDLERQYPKAKLQQQKTYETKRIFKFCVKQTLRQSKRCHS
jgi:hypothetical protein